jgi:hypothetical protein
MDTEEYQGKKQETKQTTPLAVHSSQDAMRKKALSRLQETVKANGILNEEVTAIIGAKYNKMNTKEMTTNEICDLANNIKAYIEEAMGQPIGQTA